MLSVSGLAQVYGVLCDTTSNLDCVKPCTGIQYQYHLQIPLLNYEWYINPVTAGHIVGSNTSRYVTVIWDETGPAKLCDLYGNECNFYMYVMVYEYPSPTVYGDSSVCNYSTKNYSTDGNKLDYNWSVIGGTILDQPPYGDNISVKWSSIEENGYVSINYSNESGCIGSATKTITIHQKPNVSIIGETTVCNKKYTYRANIVNPVGSYNYFWEETNGIFWSPPTNDTVVLGWDNSSDMGSVKVTVTDSYMCENTKQIPISILPSLPTTLTGNINPCIGTPTSYSTNNGQSEYVWITNNGTIQSGQGTDSVVIIWNTQGYQILSISYTSTSGCQISKDFPIMINNQPVATISGRDTAVFMSDVLYTTESNMNNYNWVVSGGGEILSGGLTNSIMVNWSEIGTGTVSVNYINPSGCVTNTFIKTVNISPSICMVTYDSILNKNKVIINPVTSGNYTSFNIYKLGTSSVDELIGNIPITETEFIDTSSIPYQTPYTYKISTIVEELESHKSPSHTTIWLHYEQNAGQVDLIWTPYKGFIFDSYHIYRKDDSGNWNQIGVVNNTNLVYTDLYAGTGTLSYYIEVIPQCNNSKSPSLTIKSNIQKIGTIGIFENNIKSLKVYPNPVSSVLNVDLKTGLNYIEIFDMNGKLLVTTQTSNDKFSINVSDYVVGLYLIKIKNINEIYLGKFNKIN